MTVEEARMYADEELCRVPVRQEGLFAGMEQWSSSMKKAYGRAVQEAMNQPAIEGCKASRDEIEKIIAEISEQLRGPMGNAERLLLVADRSELRATLAKMP
jgi:hypothetical protein